MIDKAQHNRLKIIFLLAALFLIALSITSYLRITNLVAESKLVTHTNIVKFNLQKALSMLNALESNNRGFMLTRDSAFYRPLLVAASEINLELIKIDSLTKDNPSQQQNVIVLQSLVNERLTMLQRNLTLFDASLVTVQDRLNGKKIMDDVRQQIDKMQTEEDRLLTTRSALFGKSAFFTPWFMIILILGSILILVLSYFKILSELNKSERLKVEIDQREIQIQTILQYAPDAVITFNQEGIILSWNPHAEAIFGWKESEVLGKNITEIILPARYREQYTSGLKNYLKTGDVPVINRALEIFALKKNKSEFPIELKISSSLINDRYMFIGFARDTTERQQATQILRNKTAQLVEAQQLAHIGSWEWDVQANKIEWSDELYRIYGLTPQEFEADYENFLKYIHPDDREYVNGLVQQAFKDHQPFNFFHKVVCPDGTVRVLSSTGKVFVDTNDNTIRMAGTAQDVTKQKKYEEELKESEERFLKIFNHSPIPMALSEVKTNKIKYANKHFYEAFGYSAEEVLGHTSEELNLIGPEETQRITAVLIGYLQESRSLAELQALSVEETEELLVKLKQTAEMKNLEILYTRKNGETFPATVAFEIIRLGTQRYTIASYHDITYRKKFEQQITLKSMELEQKNTELQKTNKELESFTYISSHDLQEPLRQIQNFASRIIESKEQNLTDRGKLYFDKINNAAKRMQTLIKDLLAYSRTTTSERKFVNINLSQVVKEATEEFAEEIIEKNATIDVGEMNDINVVPFQFHQLIHNLIGNALKFSQPDIPPLIKVNSTIAEGSNFNNPNLLPHKKYCHISISDNGIGFEPQYQDRIFEVFQRLHDKDKIAGTGIGLAIVKKIVDNHHGIITASGELNKGATFNIFIPA